MWPSLGCIQLWNTKRRVRGRFKLTEVGADLERKQKKKGENVVSLGVTDIYGSLSTLDILVNTSLRHCMPALITPKVLISNGIVRFISPSLKSFSKRSIRIRSKIRMSLFLY